MKMSSFLCSHFFHLIIAQTSLYMRAPKTTLMQLVSKLFLAFWALIAVAQFASGATTYSGLKDVAKITVGVTGVAHGDGCTPKVHFYSLGEILIHFFRARARKKERRSPQRRRVRSGEKNNATLSLARDSFAERRFFASRWGVVRERFSSTLIFVGRFCALHFRKCEQKALFPLKGCRFVLTETCFVLIVEAHTSSSSSSSSSPLKNHRHTKPATARLP